MKPRLLFASILAAAAAPLLYLSTANADTNESLEIEATKQATLMFSSYLAQCDGKTYAQVDDREFIEFSGPLKAVRFVNQWILQEHNRLNGVVWSGGFEAELGQSARFISSDLVGHVTAGDWQKGSNVRFTYQLKNGRWEIANLVSDKATTDLEIKLLYWETMRPNPACSNVPKIPS